MKSFILAVIFVACLVSAEAADNTASGDYYSIFNSISIQSSWGYSFKYQKFRSSKLCVITGQLVKQIQCYLQKLKAKLPATAVAQDDALIKDVKLVEHNSYSFNAEGIGRNLRDASNQLTTVLPKLKDQKLRALATKMLAKLKAAATKFESGKGNFKDIFNLNTQIRDSLKKNFGGGCGESTLPEGVSSSGNLLSTSLYIVSWLTCNGIIDF